MPGRPAGVVAQTAATFASGSSGYLAAILTGIVVAREIGPAGKGIAAFAALIMALFTTFGNGIATAVLERARAKEPLALVCGTALRLTAMTMLPLAAALLITAIVVPRFATLAYVAAAVPFAVAGQIATATLQLRGDVRSTLVQTGFTTFGTALLTIPAITVFHAGLPAVLAIWSGAFVAAGCFGLIRLVRIVPLATMRATWDATRRQSTFALKAGVSGLANFLNLRIDVFIVGLLLDTRLLGVYTLAVATGELLWQVSRPLVWTTLGRIASADRDAAAALTMKVTRNILAVEAAVALVVFALAPFAVRFVYGAAYADAAGVVRWLLPGMIVYAAQAPLAYFVMVHLARPAPLLAIQIGSVAVCALATIVLVPRIGITGAAIATSTTYCISAAIVAAMFVRTTNASARDILLLQRTDLLRFGRIFHRHTRTA